MDDKKFKVSNQKTGKFLLNLEKSKPDDRDFVAESIYSEDVEIPTELDLRQYLQPIQNQGSQGTCSAQVAACMKEYQEYMDKNLRGDENKMSPQFIYNLRSEPGMEGMTPRETMKIINKDGVCREFLLPYNSSYGLPDTTAMDDAANFKIKQYAQVNTQDGLKTALVKDGVCYICFPVYNDTQRMWKPRQGEESKGGHAMAVVGYNNDGFIIRNSWGASWGDNGYTLYPYSDWGSHWEIWTSIDNASILPDYNSEDYKRPISARGLLTIAAAVLFGYALASKNPSK